MLKGLGWSAAFADASDVCRDNFNISFLFSHVLFFYCVTETFFYFHSCWTQACNLYLITFWQRFEFPLTWSFDGHWTWKGIVTQWPSVYQYSFPWKSLEFLYKKPIWKSYTFISSFHSLEWVYREDIDILSNYIGIC